MKRISVLFLAFFFVNASCIFLVNAQNVQNSVFYQTRWKDKQWLLFENNNKVLYNIISHEAIRLLSERDRRVSELATKQDWINYQNQVREKMRASLATFSKTPLNPIVSGILERETFKVEKIIFESQPGFFVTSCLYIPKNLSGPAPAVIYCAGHTDNGFRAEVYQRKIINLVEKGCIVFAFDPIGQGERLQYYDADSAKSLIGGPTTEHSYAGIQTLLTGTSISDYFVWDAIRAIDYLETRKEVDMKRLGVTGRSGGGLQSALLMAYDDRIFAAAPECYITNYKRTYQSIGPQDAEQNPYRFIKNGFDHPDFLHLHAPKPVMMVTTTHDFFSIQGARETFSEAKKSYQAMGSPQNLTMVEDLGIHESTLRNREALYGFFIRHFNLPGECNEIEVTPFSPHELMVTKTGQVSTALKSETVFSLNRKHASLQSKKSPIAIDTLNDIAGLKFDRKLTNAVFTGIIHRENQVIEKYFLENNHGDYALPVYLIKKRDAEPDKVLVCLHPGGKEKLILMDYINQALELGYMIVAPDLPGIGELHDPGFMGDGFVKGAPFNYTFGANLAGLTIPGIQAESVSILMQYVTRILRNGLKLTALVDGELSSSFLLYAINGHPFTKILFNSPVVNHSAFVNEEFYHPHKAFFLVPGSLPSFDFKDLIELLPPASIQLMNPLKGTDSVALDNDKVILEYLR